MNCRASAKGNVRPKMSSDQEANCAFAPESNIMSSTPSSQPALDVSLPSAILPADKGFPRNAPASENVATSAELGPRRIGYGLPCLKCKTYYAADLSACPVCKTEERVSPVPVVTANSSTRLQEPVVSTQEEAALEQERERFLSEFKAQVYASDSEIDGDIDAPVRATCSNEASHRDAVELASICKSCYARLQNRVDLLEAALHIDLKEATQTIYDAVWSDPSDPSKTYHNAAQAILRELHQRAGISAVLGPLQSLAH
jgi:hypothetical protein